MNTEMLFQLHNKIAKIAPINGVSMGEEEDKATWRIDFSEEATDAQKEAAQQIIDDFVFVPEPPPIDAQKLGVFLVQKGLATQQEIDTLRIE